jgi:hypothetical protein
MTNAAYLRLREEARARRAARDFRAEALAQLAALAEQRAGLRAAWAAWNPQRAEARRLEEAVKAGTLALEVRRRCCGLCAACVLGAGAQVPDGCRVERPPGAAALVTPHLPPRPADMHAATAL